MPKSPKQAREDRLNALLAEDKKYKTPAENPEVFLEGETVVEEVLENEDGSATIQLKFTQEQRDMLFDVCLRQAVVNGLQKIDLESAEYSEHLSAKSKVIEQARVVAEVLTCWETSEDFDYSPMCAAEVALLRDLLAKL